MSIPESQRASLVATHPWCVNSATEMPNFNGMLAPVLAILRPTRIPGAMVPAYERFAILLGRLLLRGSNQPDEDAQTMAAELEAVEFQACARENVCAWEFGRVLAVVAAAGPGLVTELARQRVWPAVGPRDIFEIFGLVQAVQQAFLELSLLPAGIELCALLRMANVAWGHQPRPVGKRGRGRPPEPRTKSLYAMVARERIFLQHVSDKAAARVLVQWLPRAPTPMSVTRQVRRVRGELPAIPEGWHETLFARRIAPLARGDLLVV